MDEKRLFTVGLVMIMAGFMVVSAFGGISVSSALEEISELGIVYLPQRDAAVLLGGLGMEMVETYDDFQLVRLAASDIETLARRGVESALIGDRTIISMQSLRLDTSLEEPILAGTETSGSLYVLQFIGPVKESWLEDVRSTGVELHHYIPNYAYLVRGSLAAIREAKELRHVQWIGQYQSSYKLSQGLGEGRVRVSVWNGPEVSGTLDAIRNLCPDVTISYADYTDCYEAVTWADSAILNTLAATDGVIWIEQVQENILYDETSSEITGGIWTANTPYGGFGNYANLQGWDGTNIVIAVADTGLGNGAAGSAGHVDLTGRVVGGKDYSSSGTWADGHGHGTHCAGITSMNGLTGTGVKYASTQYYIGAGVATDAELYGQKIFTDAGSGTGIPTTQAGWDTFFQDAYNAGAYVHSNSWGENPGDGAYEANSAYYDQKVRDSAYSTTGQQPMIITVAAGNAGSGANTVGDPGSGKNVITVGASENYHPDADTYGDLYDTIPGDADNIAQVISFSSRGLEDDTRIKPDVCAPGTAILSIRSPNAPIDCLYGTYSADNRYEWCSGTSQANPHIAGASAVIVDWWQANNGGTYPMPAMVKALLINTAVDMGTADIPTGIEGWGRAYLPNIVDPPVNVQNYDNPQQLSTGQTYTLNVAYASSSYPLKITMAYTDAPGAAGANPALVNNLNLRVTAPGGQIYYGNAFDNGYSVSGTAASNADITGEAWDTNGDMFDDKNNVECVYIPTGALQAGAYTVEVIGYNVGTDVIAGGVVDQDFALTVYNALPPGTTAMATGPKGASNNPAVTITYSYSGTPTSVNLYYTKSTSSPYTWVLAGNDASVDGSYSYTITAGSGTYGWLASAVGGGSTEPSPPANTVPPEATPFVLDTSAPASPTGLTVQWYGVSTQTLLTQDFTSTTFPPTGWAVQSTGTVGTWSRQTTANAGGTSPEARYAYGANGVGTSRLYTSTAMDTTGMTSLDMQFRYMLNDYGGGYTMRVKVQTSSDGTNWHDTAWYLDCVSNTNVGPELVNLPISTSDVGSSTFMVSFTGDGNSYGLDYWYVDNVLLTYTGGGLTDDNKLDWTLSADDGGGANDVDHYNIYRSTSSSGPWTTLAGTVPAGTSTFIDSGRGEFDGTNWWYVVRAVDAAGNSDTNTVAVPEQMVGGATATATGPTGGPTNVAGVTLAYTYSGTPTSVNIYYTTNGGTTWTLAGNDASVNGAYAWTVPASGTYGWLASAVGGSSTEPSPPSGGTAPESTSYIFDNAAPSITANTFADGATGVAITAGNYNADFSENMAVAGSVTHNLPVGTTFSWVDANTYRLSYPQLAYSMTYTLTYQTTFTDIAGNALGGDRVKTFSTQAAPAATATATGPTGGPTTVTAINIAYTWTGTPTSVNLYYTTTGGTSWTLAGNDASVDGNYAWTCPGTGTYGWIASAVGGGSTEPSPPGGGTSPEAASYIVDITPPEAPSALTVEHYGSSAGGPVTVEGFQGTLGPVTAGASCVLGAPAGITPGELLVIIIGTDYNAAGPHFNAVAGWTKMGEAGSATPDAFIGVYWRIADGTEGATVTVTLSAAANFVGWYLRISGADTATPINTFTFAASTATGLTHNVPQVTTTADNCLAFYGLEWDGGDGIPFSVAGAGWSETDEQTIDGGAGTASACFGTKVQTTAGATGVAAVTSGSAGGADGAAYFQFAVQPAAAVGTVEDNTLNWTHDGTGVSSYNIYRADSELGIYVPIASIPVGTNTYEDDGMGLSDGTIWWYKVRAEDALGNEEMNDNAVPEPGGSYYSIDLTGIAAGSWAFVSFPIDISGDIGAILPDETGGTAWDVAKWYDSSVKTWKTYRRGATTNTFTAVNNQMGVWLHLTANGDDQMLPTSAAGNLPAASVVISLQAGWNMVGYPSATSRAANVALTGTGATMVSVYSATTPYITDYTNLASVTMSHGHAYWVLVPATTTWTVNP